MLSHYLRRDVSNDFFEVGHYAELLPKSYNSSFIVNIVAGMSCLIAGEG